MSPPTTTTKPTMRPTTSATAFSASPRRMVRASRDFSRRPVTTPRTKITEAVTQANAVSEWSTTTGVDVVEATPRMTTNDGISRSYPPALALHAEAEQDDGRAPRTRCPGSVPVDGVEVQGG